jgi:hypothetical protein
MASSAGRVREVASGIQFSEACGGGIVDADRMRERPWGASGSLITLEQGDTDDIHNVLRLPAAGAV